MYSRYLYKKSIHFSVYKQFAMFYMTIMGITRAEEKSAPTQAEKFDYFFHVNCTKLRINLRKEEDAPSDLISTHCASRE